LRMLLGDGVGRRMAHAAHSLRRALSAQTAALISVPAPAAAVFHKPSVEGIFIPGLQHGAGRAILGEIPPRMCMLIAFRRIAACG